MTNETDPLKEVRRAAEYPLTVYVMNTDVDVVGVRHLRAALAEIDRLIAAGSPQCKNPLDKT